MNETLKQKLNNLPLLSGVYVMKDINGQVIYVGKAKILKNRVKQYFQRTKKDTKVEAMVFNIFDLEYFVTPSEIDALALESNLIKKYKPHYNILLKDDKNFAYIKVNTKQAFPKFEITRKFKKDSCKYFGPFISHISATEILKTIHLAFPLRTSNIKIFNSKSDREIKAYSLTNVFSNEKITKEQYNKIVKQTIDFLSGKDEEIENILKEKMEKNAESENFEQALILRERLKMIERMKQKSIITIPRDLNIDVFAICHDGLSCAVSVLVCRGGRILGIQNFSLLSLSEEKGEMLSQFIMQYYEKNMLPNEILVEENFSFLSELEKLLSLKKEKIVNIVVPQKAIKKKLVDMAQQNAKVHLQNSLSKEKQKENLTYGAIFRLKEKLNLKSLPKIIECYDISNLGGEDSVASMVVFADGMPSKKNYRKFKIKTVEGPNDFLSLQEAIKRRLKRLEEKDEAFLPKPDLMIIDGGKGQLSSAYEILKQFDFEIEMISLAKKFEEVYTPNSNIPIMLQRDSQELKLIQRIRDESHRFAITFHRSLRGKKSFSSVLDKISGIGEKRKKQLLSHFESVEKIKNASVEELSKIANIGKKMAIKIKQILNE